MLSKIKDNPIITTISAILIVLSFLNLFYAKKNETVTKQEAAVMKQKIDDLIVKVSVLEYVYAKEGD